MCRQGSFEEDSSEYASTIVSAKSDERITIKMTKEGNLISGARNLRRSPAGPVEEKIWRDGKTAYIEQTSGMDNKTAQLDIPEGRTLALEGSLLVLLRFFPYDSATRWELFMIDFSGRSVTATAHQAGIERITVPAGEFSGSVIFLMALRSFSAEEIRQRTRSVSFIECAAELKGVRHDVTPAFLPLIRLFGRIDEKIFGHIESRQGMPQPSHLFSAASLRAKGLVFYHENVDVRFRAGIAPGPGAEEHHLPRLRGLDDGFRHLFKECIGNRRHFPQVYILPRVSSRD